MAKRKPGRPKGTVQFRMEDYADEIIEWISAGKMLREYCRQPAKPSWDTVYNWAKANEEFNQRFARAREDGQDVMSEECAALADTPPEGPQDVAWRKLQIETRLKLLAKWNPRKYGDRQQVDHGGGMQITLLTGVPDEEG